MDSWEKSITLGLILLALCELSQSKGLCDFDRMFPNQGKERCFSNGNLPQNKEITCAAEDFPVVNKGFFNCSGYSSGDVCNLTCNDGFYPSSSNQIMCQGKINGEGEWKDGNYTCTEILCDVSELPIVREGSFNCSGYSSGDVCNLTCNNGFYPSSSNQTLCKESVNGKGEWKDGNYTCYGCPTGFAHSLNGSCYRFVHHEFVASHSSARLTCESESSHLLFIESEEEKEFVLNYTEVNVSYWIGYNGKHDHFYWDDGSNITTELVEGLRFELYEDKQIQLCGILHRYYEEFATETKPCYEFFGYICEYEANAELIPTQCPPDMTVCRNNSLTRHWSWENEIPGHNLVFYDGNSISDKPAVITNGSHHLVYRSDTSWCSLQLNAVFSHWSDSGNSFYSFFNVYISWEAAVETCNYCDANLVVINSEEEAYFVGNLITYYSWTGLPPNSEREWQWDDLSLSYDYTGSWYEEYEPCSEIYEDGKKGFYPCSMGNPFTCERAYPT